MIDKNRDGDACNGLTLAGYEHQKNSENLTIVDNDVGRTLLDAN